MQAVIQHAHAQEQRAGDKTVRDHLHDAALDALRVEYEKSKRHESHVRDRGIGDQLFYVLLHQRHQADVHDRDERERDHQPGQLVRGIRQNRERKAQETVGAHLQHDRGQDHGTARGRLDVRIRQPGVHRPHRHLHRKGREEGEKDENLRCESEPGAVPGEDIETAGLIIKIDKGHQHQHRTEKGIKEKLDGGVNAVRPAPQADDEEHRYQHGFPENIEEDAVERAEHADHEPFHDEKRGVVLRYLRFDHLPGGDDDQHGTEARQQDQQQRNAVDTETIADVECLDPGVILDKLHRVGSAVETGIKRQRHEEGQHRDHEAQLTGIIGIAVAAGGEHRHAAEYRQPRGKTQDVFGEHDLSMQEESDQQEQSQNHGERVVIHIAGLDVANDRGHPANHARRAVYRQAVNELDVADFPEQAPDG